MEPPVRGGDDLDPLLARAIRRMREHMKEQGITQAELSERTGIRQGQISRLLGGDRPQGNFVQIVKLAHAMGLSVDGLVADLPRVGEVPAASRPGPESRPPHARQ